MTSAPGAISPPDGGYGWVIVFSSFFIHFMCNGLTLAMGVLCVAWYEEFNSSKTETSWIVSMATAVMLVMGPFASSLAMRIGYRAMAITGACLITVGSLLSSMASSIMVLMITIGFIGGIGAGMCYLPAVAVPAFYFEKRRSLAMGLGTAGIGGGMFLLAPVMDLLIQYYGWRGTMVILSGFSFNLAVAGALMRPLEAMRPSGRAQSVTVRYPNSEATSDTESLVQSYAEPDPMRELKLKLGRITIESNSDSDLTADHNSQEVLPEAGGCKSCECEAETPSQISGNSSKGFQTMGTEPLPSDSKEGTVTEGQKGSPNISAVRMEPFPAIDKPIFESDKDSSSGPDESTTVDQKHDELSSKNLADHSRHTQVRSKSMSGELPHKYQKHFMDKSNVPIPGPNRSEENQNYPPNNSCIVGKENEVSKTSMCENFIAAHKPYFQNDFEEGNVKLGQDENSNTISPTNHDTSIANEMKKGDDSSYKVLSTNDLGESPERTVGEVQPNQGPEFPLRYDSMSDKSKHLEQLLQATSDSATPERCCNCGHLQAPPGSSHSKISTGLNSDNKGYPVPETSQPATNKHHRHVFEPAQSHHRSFPDNSTHSNQADSNTIYADDRNNNHFSAGSKKPNAAQVKDASHLQEMSSSLQSMSSLDAKPALAPGIFLNDRPMGGSLTVLESETTLPLTAYTDVEACKQFRSLLGLDTDYLQKPNQKSASSLVNPKDVKATGSILTLMTLDRSLSQSKRALSRGSHEYFRSRQTLHGSYRDSFRSLYGSYRGSFRSRNGSFIRGKGKPPVSVAAKIQAAIMGQLNLLKDMTFLLFALSNFLVNLSIVMPSVFMVDRAVSLGLGTEFGSLLVSLNGAGTIFGRVAIGAIADHPRMNRLVAYMTVLVIAGAITCLSPICGTSRVMHSVYACMFGILIGNYGALCPCVMVDLKGLDAVGESYGMILMFMGLSNLIGAPAGGLLYDLTGSFSPPFVAHGLFLVGAGLICLPLLCRNRQGTK